LLSKGLIAEIVGPRSRRLNVIVEIELINDKKISPFILLPYKKGK
jgi:hypothetical protein